MPAKSAVTRYTTVPTVKLEASVAANASTQNTAEKLPSLPMMFAAECPVARRETG